MFGWEQYSNWKNDRKVSLAQGSRTYWKKPWLQSITQSHILVLCVHLLRGQDLLLALFMGHYPIWRRCCWVSCAEIGYLGGRDGLPRSPMIGMQRKDWSQGESWKGQALGSCPKPWQEDRGKDQISKTNVSTKTSSDESMSTSNVWNRPEGMIITKLRNHRSVVFVGSNHMVRRWVTGS